jgi:hypothetical protein
MDVLPIYRILHMQPGRGQPQALLEHRQGQEHQEQGQEQKQAQVHQQGYPGMLRCRK